MTEVLTHCAEWKKTKTFWVQVFCSHHIITINRQRDLPGPHCPDRSCFLGDSSQGGLSRSQWLFLMQLLLLFVLMKEISYEGHILVVFLFFSPEVLSQTRLKNTNMQHFCMKLRRKFCFFPLWLFISFSVFEIELFVDWGGKKMLFWGWSAATL